MLKTVKGKNSQQCLFIQGMFGLKPQVTATIVHAREKHSNISIEIHVIPSGHFVAYKTRINGSESLWSSWGSPEEVESWFKTCSLL